MLTIFIYLNISAANTYFGFEFCEALSFSKNFLRYITAVLSDFWGCCCVYGVSPVFNVFNKNVSICHTNLPRLRSGK